jgi:hypothetical protein
MIDLETLKRLNAHAFVFARLNLEGKAFLGAHPEWPQINPGVELNLPGIPPTTEIEITDRTKAFRRRRALARRYGILLCKDESGHLYKLDASHPWAPSIYEHLKQYDGVPEVEA